jgi:hypothetical protein
MLDDGIAEELKLARHGLVQGIDRSNDRSELLAVSSMVSGIGTRPFPPPRILYHIKGLTQTPSTCVPSRVFAFMASRFGSVHVSFGLGIPSGRADCGSAVPHIEQP